jgi:hypothetical protein
MPQSTDAPITASEAVQRAQTWATTAAGCYQLGEGDYFPVQPNVPLTKGGCDCDGFVLWAWRTPRHRKGYNVGSWATVSDDVNPNSLLEDAQHAKDLCTPVMYNDVRPGDLLCYPTFHYQDAHGAIHEFIGHIAIIVAVPAGFKVGQKWTQLQIVQVCGPNGRVPAALTTDGSVFDTHDATWPVPIHTTDRPDELWNVRADVVRMIERP